MSEEAVTTNQEILKSEDVELSIHRKPSCSVEFIVKASAPLVKKAHAQAVRSVAKEVSLPGFRKGKAPQELIIKRYPDAVDQQWQKAIADDSFHASEKLARIPVLSTKAPITFNMQKHSLEEGAELTFSFETEPDVPAVDLTKLHLADLPKETIKEETVDEGIRQISFFFAEWQTIEDRGAEPNDFLLLDIYTLQGEEPQKIFNDTRFEVAEKTMSQWMRDLTLGMKTGEEKEGISKPDDDASEEDKKSFEPRKVKVVVKKIETAKLPAIDDAFATKVGCKTVDEMRQNIRQLFEKRNNEGRNRALCDHLAEDLLKAFPFDLPKSILNEEVKFRMKHNLQNAKFKKEWEAMSDDEKKDYLEKLQTQAENSVRLFYLCRRVVNDANIPLSSEELKPADPTFIELLLGLRSPYEQQPSKEEEAIAMSRLMLHKAQSYLIEQLEKKTS
ncbi:MAG TPA: trigger factor [Chlamydiales bacterium]|nr:trigger factor [Chlamydiales bacterium]